MLVDLPIPVIRYAALLNTAAMHAFPDDPPIEPFRLVDWRRERQGVYEQIGFADLPWLVEWPHEKALKTALWAVIGMPGGTE